MQQRDSDLYYRLDEQDVGCARGLKILRQFLLKIENRDTILVGMDFEFNSTFLRKTARTVLRASARENHTGRRALRTRKSKIFSWKNLPKLAGLARFG
jgi:hypothetical protein